MSVTEFHKRTHHSLLDAPPLSTPTFTKIEYPRRSQHIPNVLHQSSRSFNRGINIFSTTSHPLFIPCWESLVSSFHRIEISSWWHCSSSGRISSEGNILSLWILVKYYSTVLWELGWLNFASLSFLSAVRRLNILFQRCFLRRSHIIFLHLFPSSLLLFLLFVILTRNHEGRDKPSQFENVFRLSPFTLDHPDPLDTHSRLQVDCIQR